MLATIFLFGVMGGIIVVLATSAVESCGGKVGGIFSSCPHLLVLAISSVAFHAQTREAVEQAVFVVPVTVLADIAFLLSWQIGPRFIVHKNIYVRVFLLVAFSVVVWTFVALLLTLSVSAFIAPPLNISIHLIAFISSALAFSSGLVGSWNHRSSPKGQNKVGFGVHFARFLVGAMAVCVTGYLAELDFGLLAGVMSMFPSIYGTLMASIWLSQGENVSTGTIAPLMLGMTAINIFVILFGYLYLYAHLKLAVACLCAWFAAALLGSMPTYGFFEWRRKVLTADIEKEMSARKSSSFLLGSASVSYQAVQQLV